jgi:K+ potassium transporter
MSPGGPLRRLPHGGDARPSFGSSTNLAAAYGIAVSATMVATTVLLSIAMREIWNWPLPAVIMLVDRGRLVFRGHS